MKWPKTFIVVSHAREFLNTGNSFELFFFSVRDKIYSSNIFILIVLVNSLLFSGGHRYSSSTWSKTDCIQREL